MIVFLSWSLFLYSLQSDEQYRSPNFVIFIIFFCFSIGAELRGTKLLTSTWLHASDICKGKVDVLDYDNKEAFGTESGLSAEMIKCVEEARHAVTTFVQMKK